MLLKKNIKKLVYGSLPGFSGSFPYFGTKVYFPKNSYIFGLACDQGIYEAANLKLMLAQVKPNSVYFDIGANIGLMSIPVLHQYSSCKVVSVEPSPNSLPFLTLTANNSQYKDRWNVIGKAMGNSVGEITFSAAALTKMGAFDSIQDANTKRVVETNRITVPMTTLDTEWESMGKPAVSLIKIDVEGAEFQVLQGGINCIKHEQPSILLEWNAQHLKAYDCEPEKLLHIADFLGYRNVLALPSLISVNSSSILKLCMVQTESFLLLPES